MSQFGTCVESAQIHANAAVIRAQCAKSEHLPIRELKGLQETIGISSIVAGPTVAIEYHRSGTVAGEALIAMRQTEIRTAIDHHSHEVRGVRYTFRLQWAALEPRWSSRSARYLLAIEVLTDARSGSSTMHVVVRAGTNRSDLIQLVEDALEDYLEREHPATVTAYASERTPDLP